MRLYLFCLLISVFPAAAHAAVAQQEMRPGIPASADYLSGEPGKPAVLLLHGFLQTRDFPTVATLARGLQDAGYTVLAPTLSLNIPTARKAWHARRCTATVWMTTWPKSDAGWAG